MHVRKYVRPLHLVLPCLLSVCHAPSLPHRPAATGPAPSAAKRHAPRTGCVLVAMLEPAHRKEFHEFATLENSCCLISYRAPISTLLSNCLYTSQIVILSLFVSLMHQPCFVYTLVRIHCKSRRISGRRFDSRRLGAGTAWPLELALPGLTVPRSSRGRAAARHSFRLLRLPAAVVGRAAARHHGADAAALVAVVRVLQRHLHHLHEPLLSVSSVRHRVRVGGRRPVPTGQRVICLSRGARCVTDSLRWHPRCPAGCSMLLMLHTGCCGVLLRLLPLWLLDWLTGRPPRPRPWCVYQAWRWCTSH